MVPQRGAQQLLSVECQNESGFAHRMCEATFSGSCFKFQSLISNSSSSEVDRVQLVLDRNAQAHCVNAQVVGHRQRSGQAEWSVA